MNPRDFNPAGHWLTENAWLESHFYQLTM